jgi:hypothetical protein
LFANILYKKMSCWCVIAYAFIMVAQEPRLICSRILGCAMLSVARNLLNHQQFV